MRIQIPNLSLVILIGPSGAGKSTFAAKHFLGTEVLSSDYCRGLVSDDENSQAATTDAFDVLHYIAGKRLAAGKLTVVDATNVQPEARKPLVALARQHHCLPVAVVLNLPANVCHARNQQRENRNFGPHVVRQQRSQLHRSLKGLRREGFRNITVMETEDEVAAATVERVPLWNDRRELAGPFDIIGDVHGCFDELQSLLENLGYQRLGYQLQPESTEALPALPFGETYYRHPDRTAIFLGDLCDRGPNSVATYQTVMNMVAAGAAMCVPGNHDMKLLRYLRGKKVQLTHGLAETAAQIEALPTSPEDLQADFRKKLIAFLDGLISHYVLDHGKLVVAHAGLKAELQGRGSGRVREFCLYGETTGETDEFGLPVRHNWAAEYRGKSLVVYGHTPVPEPDWLNNTVNVDTGCVFGGKLTALRYPENETVSVAAKEVYCQPAKPFLETSQAMEESLDGLTAQQLNDDVLDADDVRGKRIVSTRLQRNITIRAENAAAAWEVMSRFAVDPKWLIYLPPTMSPCETSQRDGLLEHPEDAFSYYRHHGMAEVICEEKHMGSRAVVVVCQDQAAAAQRFGVTDGSTGIIATRTGRRFLNDEELESQLLERLRAAMTVSDFWSQFNTTWAMFDCELMPWSAKAQELLKSQYASVGSAGTAGLQRAAQQLEVAGKRLTGEAAVRVLNMLDVTRRRAAAVEQFINAYRHYCWPVNTLDDFKLAPFHLLATENVVHTDKNHLWHMTTLAEICKHDAVLLATNYHVVDTTNPTSEQQAIAWWEQLTAAGGEGMVVKPLDWIVRGKEGLLQPAVKCRGPEYLRIIYGPDYCEPKHLARLRHRGLGRKRSLAVREFALGIEALERFVRKEPLRRVHECVFGVLALESEPVDPRL